VISAVADTRLGAAARARDRHLRRDPARSPGNPKESDAGVGQLQRQSRIAVGEGGRLPGHEQPAAQSSASVRPIDEGHPAARRAVVSPVCVRASPGGINTGDGPGFRRSPRLRAGERCEQQCLCITGNGTFDASTNGDWGDTF